jgi:sorting nexin-1/2
MKSGHIVYTCKGVDEQGSWEGDRRFNEFFKLRAMLEQRWPGIPIPELPPKKAIGNKDIKFINERRFYLERFLKKMAAFPYILNSKEFLIFTRPPSSDIEKSINAIPKLPTSEIVDRQREALKCEDHLYDPIQKDKLDG